MKKIFYHVVTERPMYLNQEIIFDENNHSGVYERVIKQKDLIDKVYQNENIELTDDLKKALREFALEEVRLEKYPNYPSRLSCLYVSNTLEEAEFWYNTFINQNRPTFQIVKIEVEGSYFTGDAWNCFEGTSNKEENLKLAKNYWDNKKNTRCEKPIYETLVNGKIKIIGIERENDEQIRKK